MPLRLLFVIDSLGSGGAQRQMVTLAQGLQARGHVVEFFLYAPGDIFLPWLQRANIPVFPHLKKSKYSIDVVWALRQRIKVGQYNLVLAYMATPSFYTIMASRLLINRPRVVVSERNTDPPEGIPRQETIVRHLYRFADFVVPNSNYQETLLLKKHPWLKDKTKTIVNGLDLQQFYPPKDEPPDDTPKLLAIGSLKPQKNALCLVRALHILAKEHAFYPQVSWVGKHFDKSYPSHFAYSQQVKQEITERELTKQWQWLHERNDVVNLLHQHHALVHPSYREGFPNVVCEALACGRPVILSDTLEHPQLVKHNYSGFLFDWRDPYALAQAIRTLYDLPAYERHQIGLRGRQFAEQNLSFQIMADKYEELFLVLTS